MILVGSEPEWKEAVSCSPSSPMKLYVNLKTDEQTDETADLTNEETTFGEDLPAPFSMIPEGFYSEVGVEEPSIDEQRHLTESIPEIIAQLAGPSRTLPSWMMGSIATTTDDGDVLLDINIPRFSLALHSRALDLLVRVPNSLALDTEAVGLLRHCVRLTPGDQHANFNLACGLSRIGETAQALPPLEKYVALGGRIENIYNDADLKNVRASPDFVEFEQRNPNVAPEKEEEEKAEEASPSVDEPSSPSSDKWEDELKALQELGITDDFGRLLLEDSDGDLEGIVAAQFQSQFL